MTTVGTDNYTYQLIENWAKLPAGQTFGNTSAVTTDSRDRVYVFQRKDPPVMIFDREGNFLDSWGAGVITDPHGICIHDDIVYLTDRSDSVALKFTLEGKPLQILGDRGVHSDTGGERPGELVPSPSGDLYVSDGYRNARVHRFSGDGQLISSWGEPGKEGPNQFHLPHSVLVDEEGTVFVCDRENTRIQVFSADGQFRETWSDLRRPLDISMDSDGVLCVSEGAVNGLSARVSLLDKRGNVVARWDANSAHGSWIDAHGDIYMALGAMERVDKYVRQG